MTIKTTLNHSDTHSNSLKTTVPKEIVSKFGLKKGSVISWDEVTFLSGIVLIGDKKKTIKEPENLIVVRIKGGK